MEDIPYPSDLERLRGNVLAELRAQSAMARLDLDQRTLDHFADGIVANIDYAFSFHWAPRWVHDGEPHRWTEQPGDAPTTWFVECLPCKRITAHSSQADADGWWEHHHAEHA